MASLRRFLVKCCVYASDELLTAIIRRIDTDADCKLNRSEFENAVQPLENFSKSTLSDLKQSVRKVRDPKVDYRNSVVKDMMSALKTSSSMANVANGHSPSSKNRISTVGSSAAGASFSNF